MRSFDAHQLLIRVKENPAVVPVPRQYGDPARGRDEKSVAALAAGLTQWLTTQVQPDGRMIYMAQPSRGVEAKDNNMIRQFMATVCLVRWAMPSPTTCTYANSPSET